MPRTRRQFIRDLGLSAAAIPFVLNLPSLAFANQRKRKQRIIFMFSPNGVVRKNFWPDKDGLNFDLKEILTPLKPFQDRMLVLNGLSDLIRGDGDGHMRGMSCLLTAIELFQNPGHIAAAKAEFNERRGPNFVYEPLLGNRKPPLDYRVNKAGSE